MMPLNGLAYRYRKVLLKHSFVKFECTECQKPVLARIFELHCLKEHGFDPSTNCVWCKTETWPAKTINYKHLIVCLMKFVKRLSITDQSYEKTTTTNKDKSSSSSIRIQVSHSRCIASLAVGASGFTLFDGRTSVTHEGSLDHSKLASEVSSMRIGRLYAADDRSLAKWKDVAQSYSLSQEIDVVEPVVSSSSRCEYCGSKNCHRWKAVECLSRALNYNFDHVEHGPLVVPNHQK